MTQAERFGFLLLRSEAARGAGGAGTRRRQPFHKGGPLLLGWGCAEAAALRARRAGDTMADHGARVQGCVVSCTVV